MQPERVANGPCRLGGRILASLAQETQDEWSGCGLVRPMGRDFPREPIRYVGGQLVRRAVAACAPRRCPKTS